MPKEAQAELTKREQAVEHLLLPVLGGLLQTTGLGMLLWQKCMQKGKLRGGIVQGTHPNHAGVQRHEGQGRTEQKE